MFSRLFTVVKGYVRKAATYILGKLPETAAKTTIEYTPEQIAEAKERRIRIVSNLVLTAATIGFVFYFPAASAFMLLAVLVYTAFTIVSTLVYVAKETTPVVPVEVVA